MTELVGLTVAALIAGVAGFIHSRNKSLRQMSKSEKISARMLLESLRD